MKNLFFTFALTIITLPFLSAQDLIVTKSGDMVEAKVLEIELEQIKYKRFNHQDGPTIATAKKDVFFIKYENGMKEVISSIEASPIPKPEEDRSIQKNNYTVKQFEKTEPVPKKYEKVQPSSASFERYNKVSLLAGISLPVGSDFSEYTATGFHLGIENTSMFKPNVGFTSHLSVNFNKSKSDDYYYDFEKVINTFGLSGIRFGTSGNQTNVFGLAMVGVNWMIYEDDYGTFNEFHLAAGAGLGVEISQLVEIGLRINHDFSNNYSSLQISAGLSF